MGADNTNFIGMRSKNSVMSQFENKYLATAQRRNVWLWHATSLRRCAAARIQTATLPKIQKIYFQ
jgi:hypothetical protein